MNVTTQKIEPLQLEPVPPPELLRIDPRYPGVWKTVKPYLEAALAKDEAGDWLIEDVYQQILMGAVELWTPVSRGCVFGAVITQAVTYPRRRVLEVLLLGTNKHTEKLWFQCLDQLKNIALQSGFDCLQGTGRPGWARKLDATRTKTVWELDLKVK